MVTHKGESDEVTTFKAGPEIKNLAQVKKGDLVTMEYARAMAVELKKGGSGIAGMNRIPAGVVTEQDVVVANVEKVDAAARTVTVRGGKGNVTTHEVKAPAVLAQIEVGDQIQAACAEARLVSVSAPKKQRAQGCARTGVAVTRSG
jgi:hypothetical protein